MAWCETAESIGDREKLENKFLQAPSKTRQHKQTNIKSCWGITDSPVFCYKFSCWMYLLSLVDVLGYGIAIWYPGVWSTCE
jgi:hypothetical protein